MYRDYPNILSRLINEPLLAHPTKAEVIAGAVLRRQGVEVNVAASAEFVNAPKAGPLQERRMVERSEGMPFLFDAGTGIAVIPIAGSLAHRQGFIGKSSGVLGYDGLAAQFQAALDSPSVRGIMFDLHTPGGEVHGAFQLADRIAAARGRKPMIAVSDEMAYSAGYLLASACDEIWLASSTAGVGSIGCVVVHASYQQMLEAEGIRVTVFRFGSAKAEMNPFEDLSKEAADRVQARIDYLGREFVSRVAKWRGMSEKSVIDTQAATFVGQEAVRLRLANGVADPVDVFRAFAQDISRRPYGRPLQ